MEESKMSDIANALADLKIDDVPRMVKEKLDAGVDAMSIIDECRQGMEIVGERYKEGRYFLGELIVSGKILESSMKVVETELADSIKPGDATVVVIGTVKGDIHQLGKDLVAVLLKGAGFEVHDLGIDVAPQAFVDKIRETGATILGMSGLLTTSFTSMKDTVDAVVEAGLRDKVKVVVGGGVVTELVLRHTGADAFTRDGLEGVDICKRFAAEAN
jgi:5-methyltetrahydrofolate--homocysteine methyltransferase